MVFGPGVERLPGAGTLKAGARVFVAPIEGFDDALRTALQTKRVPLVVVTDRLQTEFEISGHSETIPHLVFGTWERPDQ